MEGISNREDNPGAVIIDGHGRADLGLIRALGERNVPVYLLTDDRRSPITRSRYITAILPFPSLRGEESSCVRALMQIGQQFAHRPVFFSTGDRSLMLFARHRAELEQHYRHHIGDPGLITALYDKVAFVRLGHERKLPVPFSLAPGSLDELERDADRLSFPVMVKPAEKRNWAQFPQVHRLVGGNLKGVRVESREALLRLYQDLTPYDNRIVIQNYIEGRDEEIYSLHTYIDRQGDVTGIFTGQKMRTWPIHRGIGCFQLSVIEPQVVNIGVGALRAIGYTGHAIVQVKRNPDTGSFEIFEINCRYSTWNYLHTRSGVNLPYAAYRDSLGEKQRPLPLQREGCRWIDAANDIKAFREYRRIGEWSTGAWLRTYIGSNCYAVFSWRDPMPTLAPLACQLGGAPFRLARRFGYFLVSAGKTHG